MFTVRVLVTGILHLMRQVNIIGKGSGWKLAPLTGLSWGINNINLLRPIDVIFEMHTMEVAKNLLPRCQEYLDVARENKTLAYSIMDCEVGGFKFKRFPIEKIVKEFDETFFSCSVDFMIAFAIYSKFDKIDVYGVNLVHGHEHSYERPGVEFWRGYAKGRGIDIKFHGPICEVGKTKMGIVYGYIVPQKDFKQSEWLTNPQKEIKWRTTDT